MPLETTTRRMFQKCICDHFTVLSTTFQTGSPPPAERSPALALTGCTNAPATGQSDLLTRPGPSLWTCQCPLSPETHYPQSKDSPPRPHGAFGSGVQEAFLGSGEVPAEAGSPLSGFSQRCLPVFPCRHLWLWDGQMQPVPVWTTARLVCPKG